MAGTSTETIDTFFKQRDQAWFGGGSGVLAATPGISYSAQAKGEIDKIAKIAREIGQESGLAASDVQTSTASADLTSTCTSWADPEMTTCLAGRSTHQTEVGTTLKGNLGGAGDSYIGDGYTVTLTWAVIRRYPLIKAYTVDRVELTPVPRDDAEPATAPTPAELGLKPASTDRGEAVAAQERMRARGDCSPKQSAGAYSFDPNAAAAYALRWANGFNPDYRRLDNDCTNFVSQALEAGGWPIRQGVDPLQKSNWSPDLIGPHGPSRTWSVSAFMAEFAAVTTDRAIPLGRARRNVPASIIIKIAANSWNSRMYFYPFRTKLSFTS